MTTNATTERDERGDHEREHRNYEHS